MDSRQRKKKHTEELEVEKKVWTDKYCVLQDDFNSLRAEYENMLAEKENWHREQMEMHHLVTQLQFDKEELIRTHTLETGDLRNRAVARGGNEIGELPVGDRRSVHPEAVDTDLMGRPFLRIVPFRSHAEMPAVDPHHAGGGGVFPDR